MSAVPGWVADYIGLPYADEGRSRETGLDCWGLVRLVYLEQRRIVLPCYRGAYAGAEEVEDVARLIAGEVPAWQEVVDPRVFDLLLLRVRGVGAHVGMVIGPGLMLHVMRGIETAVERTAGTVWARRVLRTYRHTGADHAS